MGRRRPVCLLKPRERRKIGFAKPGLGRASWQFGDGSGFETFPFLVGNVSNPEPSPNCHEALPKPGLADPVLLPKAAGAPFLLAPPRRCRRLSRRSSSEILGGSQFARAYCAGRMANCRSLASSVAARSFASQEGNWAPRGPNSTSLAAHSARRVCPAGDH